MSSVFSKASNQTIKASKSRRRSSSETRFGSNTGRTPTINFAECSDVSSAICLEISKLMSISPDMITGKFFNAMSNSQKDLNKSDAVLVITAAILKHVGNEKMSNKILERSKTCRGYFEDMNLSNSKICEMFTIMLFALNPTFCTMLNTSIQVALSRADSIIADQNNGKNLAHATSALVRDGVWTQDEALKVIIPNSPTLQRKFLTEGSFQKTPEDMIHPSDSVTEVGSVPDYRKRIEAQDMMEFITRRKRGKEPNFSDTFRSRTIPVPISAKQHARNRGLGYNESADGVVNTPPISIMNNLLGSQRRPSIDLRTGRERYRVPRVEDFHDQDAASEAVLKLPSDSRSNPWDNPGFKVPNAPSPTEMSLAETNYFSSTGGTNIASTSFDNLMATLAS